MDSETLTFLLRQGHLDMKTRVERGIWPHAPLKYDDVLQHLVQIIKKETWFPRVWESAVEGKPIYEGGVIERKSPNKYVYHSQRHQAYSPYILAEEMHKEFNSAESIAKHYLKWDLNLPGDLDGWKVIL
jgi:hypothetical protein